MTDWQGWLSEEVKNRIRASLSETECQILEESSEAAWFANLDPAEQQEILSRFDEATLKALRHSWAWWARRAQKSPPGSWRTWLVLAGRGFGKTRTGAEWVRMQITDLGRRRIALVAPTAADVRDVMVEGESGILAICPSWNKPRYEPSKRRLTWPNGAIATTYSADEPERLRGPQHDGAWCDEIASWRYPDAWDMLMFGLRLGNDPRAIVTTTPKPIKIIRELLADPNTTITRGSTYQNAANLAGAFLDQIVRKYEGTRLGRQELEAEVLDDVPGALWTRAQLEEARWPYGKNRPDFTRVVVAIDPAASAGEESDETGIIVAAKDIDGRGYVLADKSGRYHPNEWAKHAIDLYREFRADRVVAEVNNGGEMVGNTLSVIDPNVSFTPVRASRGKVVRAEPVSALYEQHRVFHVGAFPTLEDQMCMFTSDFDRKQAQFSPDRVDALVWAFTELLVEASPDQGYLEWLRAEHEAKKAAAAKPAPITNYAVGSVEWAAAHGVRLEDLE
jgi:predicted phage terminase large subunit-like protein